MKIYEKAKCGKTPKKGLIAEAIQMPILMQD